MTIVGNILLFISSLVYIGLAYTILGKQPHSGDYAVSYGWTVLLLNALLVIFLTITTIIIAAKGGFSWVGPTASSRFFIVTIVLVAVLFTTAMCSILKNERGPVPAFIRSLCYFAPFIIPLLLIFASFILLNGVEVSKAVYQYPLIAVSILGLVGLTAGISSWITDSIKKENRRMKKLKEDVDSNQQRMLGEIESCDVTKNILFILVFTDSNQEPVIREKAVAKIKTNPAWQQELVRILKTGWAPEAFTFLASNGVDSTGMFIDPIKEGILQQAKSVRESTRSSSHSSHFYPELFLRETEKVLATADRFSNTDYTPQIKELKAALEEPSALKGTKLLCVDYLITGYRRKNSNLFISAPASLHLSASCSLPPCCCLLKWQTRHGL